MEGKKILDQRERLVVFVSETCSTDGLSRLQCIYVTYIL